MKKILAAFALVLLPLLAIAGPPTLMEMAGVHPKPARLSESVLVVIDAQKEYVSGALPLAGIDAALKEGARLVARARAAGTPIIHVAHRGGGALFNPKGPYFAFTEPLLPEKGETVIEKRLPNAFAGTGLQQAIDATGRRQLIIIGFMTHMCVSATARAALDLGYRTTVVAAATATRDLPDGDGGTVSAATVQRAALAALADRFAVVVPNADAISGQSTSKEQTVSTYTFEDPTQQVIWTTLRALNDAWTRGNPDDLAHYFHPKMIAITATDRHRREGAESCIAGWKGFAEAAQIHYWHEIDPVIHVYGDSAVVAYDFDMSFDMGGQTIQMGGRDMFFFVKEQGRWWAVADQFSAYPRSGA